MQSYGSSYCFQQEDNIMDLFHMVQLFKSANKIACFPSVDSEELYLWHQYQYSHLQMEIGISRQGKGTSPSPSATWKWAKYFAAQNFLSLSIVSTRMCYLAPHQTGTLADKGLSKERTYIILKAMQNGGSFHMGKNINL